MILEHRGKRPTIHATATIAPNAVVCGDVTIGANSRVLFGAVVTADGGPVTIGSNCIIMEQAVVRGTPKHPLRFGNNCLLGPHGYACGCTAEDDVFMATGCAIFNGARLGKGSEVRIHGVVHLRTVVPAGATVPIGWVAVGDPALIRPPKDHDEIWAVQESLNFPKTVFGVDRVEGQSKMPEVCRRYAKALAAHSDDVVLEDPESEDAG